MVANILVNFNEYYSDNLSDITNDNKKTNAEKGRWNGGPAPFGLKKNFEDVFVADGYKAAAVIQSFKMAKGGKGPYVISKWLNKESIHTETNIEWTPRRGIFYSLINFESLVSWEDFLYILSSAIQDVFDDFYIHKKLSEHHYSELMKRYEVRQNEIQKRLEKMPLPKTNNKYSSFDDLLNELAIAFEIGLEPLDKRIMTELIIEKNNSQ